MCGRYGVNERAVKWMEKIPKGEPFSFKTGDMHPTEIAPSLVWGKEGPILLPMRWGMERKKDRKLVINARAESIFERPMFSKSITSRRCILAASHFYEWDKDRHKVTFKGEEDLLFLAGFFSPLDGQNRFVIITQPADDVMKPVHDRMPVRIPRERIKDWLMDESSTRELLGKAYVRLRKEQDVEEISLF